MHRQTNYKQQGISLVGLIVVLALLGLVFVLGMKIVPTFTEYNAVKTAIAKAKTSGSTVAEIKSSFDKQASAVYIDSISSNDLEIVKDGDQFEISFAYDKKIPLVGPASLLIEYSGTTAKSKPGKKAEGL